MLVSIHLMYQFKLKDIIDVDLLHLFQYISCISSSKTTRFPRVWSPGFNTSHVSVQDNESHNRSCRTRVSIHLMYQFKLRRQWAFLALRGFQYISCISSSISQWDTHRVHFLFQYISCISSSGWSNHGINYDDRFQYISCISSRWLSSLV